MSGWVARRIVTAGLTVWVAVSLAFIVLRLLPGDAISAQLALSGATESQIAERRAALGLDAPLLTQYLTMIGGLLQGDLGWSLVTGRPVSQMIAEQVWPTVGLAAAALMVAVLVGVGLALGAVFGGPFVRPIAALITLILMASPIYWTGTLAIYLFSVALGWLPSAGSITDVRAWVLPVAVLGLSVAGGLSRVIAAELTHLRRADFVRTAYAKGLPRRVVAVRHVLRAGLGGAITLITLQAGYLLGGAVVTETLFVRRGLGGVLLGAVNTQDYPVIQGLVVFNAIVYSVVTTFGDLVGAAIDPRLREPQA
jgi:ABC-type dipeptide/oligopeptide/nickel transport system permease component